MRNVLIAKSTMRERNALCTLSQANSGCPVDVCTYCPLNTQVQMNKYLKDNQIEIVFKSKGDS